MDPYGALAFEYINNENNVYNTVYNSVSYQKELTYLAYGIGFNCIELWIALKMRG